MFLSRVSSKVKSNASKSITTILKFIVTVFEESTYKHNTWQESIPNSSCPAQSIFSVIQEPPKFFGCTSWQNSWGHSGMWASWSTSASCPSSVEINEEFQSPTLHIQIPLDRLRRFVATASWSTFEDTLIVSRILDILIGDPGHTGTF